MLREGAKLFGRVGAPARLRARVALAALGSHEQRVVGEGLFVRFDVSSVSAAKISRHHVNNDHDEGGHDNDDDAERIARAHPPRASPGCQTPLRARAAGARLEDNVLAEQSACGWAGVLIVLICMNLSSPRAKEDTRATRRRREGRAVAVRRDGGGTRRERSPARRKGVDATRA